jgi:hypothetical protein
MARFENPSYKTETVFAAACAAHRVNSGYFKEDQIKYFNDGEYEVEKVANKKLIHQFLTGSFEVTQEDVDMANNVRQYCHSLSFNILRGKTLSDFENTMLKIAESEMIDSRYDIAVASCLPMSYERNQIRIQENIILREKSGTLDNNIGDKVQLQVEVVRCNYSKQWNIWYVTGTVDNAVVFFGYKNKIDSGSIINVKGTVKDHKDDRTQLTRVKVL